jgi:hypothetical protein
MRTERTVDGHHCAPPWAVGRIDTSCCPVCCPLIRLSRGGQTARLCLADLSGEPTRGLEPRTPSLRALITCRLQSRRVAPSHMNPRSPPGHGVPRRSPGTCDQSPARRGLHVLVGAVEDAQVSEHLFLEFVGTVVHRMTLRRRRAIYQAATLIYQAATLRRLSASALPTRR